VNGYLRLIILIFPVVLFYSQGASSRPNIVLIISDDQDAAHLGFMGSSIARTPNLDQLAEQGVVFTTAHVTAPRCRPSLASLLSGRFPHQSGIFANIHLNSNRLKYSPSNNNQSNHHASEITLDVKNSLPNVLKRAGYVTFVSGKYWEGDPALLGFTHGYSSEKHRASGNFFSNFKKFVREDGQVGLFSFIDRYSGNTPMFIWWAPLMPHRPHNPPDQYKKMFDAVEIPIPEFVTPDDRDEFIRLERLSLAMEAWTDEEFGRLRSKMQQVGQDENTLYVFLIDNGWSNGLPAKGSPFEKGLRTPIVFTSPSKIDAGQIRADLVSSVDIYPTILQYAGLMAPENMAGIGLLGHIDNGTSVGREKLFGAVYGALSDTDNPEQDVYALYLRTTKYKYIYYTKSIKGNINDIPLRIHHILADPPYREKGEEDLYHLEKDPYERNDLSEDIRYQSIIERFRKDVFSWWPQSPPRFIAKKD